MKSVRVAILLTLSLAGAGAIAGCGPTQPRALRTAAEAKADDDAMRNIIIQRSVQEVFRPSTQDYGSGYKN